MGGQEEKKKAGLKQITILHMDEGASTSLVTPGLTTDRLCAELVNFAPYKGCPTNLPTVNSLNPQHVERTTSPQKQVTNIGQRTWS